MFPGLERQPRRRAHSSRAITDVRDFPPWIGREAEFRIMVQTILLPAITKSGLSAAP